MTVRLLDKPSLVPIQILVILVSMYVGSHIHTPAQYSREIAAICEPRVEPHWIRGEWHMVLTTADVQLVWRRDREDRWLRQLASLNMMEASHSAQTSSTRRR